jgi:hypothetical protein
MRALRAISEAGAWAAMLRHPGPYGGAVVLALASSGSLHAHVLVAILLVNRTCRVLRRHY